MAVAVSSPFNSRPLFRSLWWDSDLPSPSRIFDQFFGVGLRENDIFPQQHSGIYLRPRRAYNRQDSGISEVSNSSDAFKVSLELPHFSPQELTVTASRDTGTVTVRGQHEERSDEHGFVSRCFVRRFVLPPGSSADDVVSELSAEGTLTISVPKKPAVKEAPKERIVLISKALPPPPAPSVTSGEQTK